MSTDSQGSSQASAGATAIKALDGGSIHKITSGQVVVDLQTAVKELVENSLDAGATNIEVRFKDYGLESFEVIDNGSGIRPDDYHSIALKHHTSKLTSFADLESVATFGFRGEALSSLCALAECVTVTTATATEAPVGTVLEFERTGKLKEKRGKAARQRGTTVSVAGLFKPLPVRRKELERNAKREYAKALTLLHAYALVPCARENAGVRLSVSNHPAGGKKTVQLRTDGTPDTRASVSAIWNPKALENLVELELKFEVEVEAAVLRRLGRAPGEESTNEVCVRGLISKFVVGAGRNGTDRQFFFVNGRPCSPSKVQKAFNEVYRSFNATQSPFVIADFILPKNSCDVNVSPDKRTILLHSENNLVQALKSALEEKYAPSRATFDVNTSQAPRKTGSATAPQPPVAASTEKEPLFLPEDTQDVYPDVSSAPSTSQPESDEKHASVPSALDQEDGEPSFGEPMLLSEPASSSSVAPTSKRTSSRRASTPEDEDAEDEASVSAAVDVSQDVPDPAMPKTPSPPERAASRRNPARGDIPQSAAVRRDARAPASSPAAPTRPVARRVASPVPADATAKDAEDDDGEDDAPIPALRPPARTVARASGAPRGGGSSVGSSQMVLSTSGAAWNLRRRGEEPPKKKPRIESGAREAREGMRAMLRGFAREGAKVEEESVGDDGAEDEEGVDEVEGMDEDVEMDGQGDEPLEGDQEDVDAGRQDPPASEPSEGQIELGQFAQPDESMEQDETRTSEIIDVDADVDVVQEGSQGTGATSAVKDEVVRTVDREAMSLSVDMSSITASWKTLRSCLGRSHRSSNVMKPSDKVKLDGTAGIGDATNDDEAVEALSRVIDKTDFAEMEIVGQFNLGFIIVRRQKPCSDGDGSPGEAMDDLFIVDQHASDEKYNFETLQRTTKIDSQKLYRPQLLELTAADELVAIENVEVLRQNGFELDVDEDAHPGQRVRLTAQPISKSTVFDTKDLEELLHLMHDRPTGQMVRCSKARAMFASRACRKSVMIGTALSRRQMTTIVEHMGTIDQPWHCPHGRPTMRHLSDIVGVGWELRQSPTRGIDWPAFNSDVSDAS